MQKHFNITGLCKPQQHYMVDIEERLRQIKVLIDDGQYFVINRARQYGKTTTLYALKRYLSEEYIVVSLDFQMLSSDDFADDASFVAAFAQELLAIATPAFEISDEQRAKLNGMADGTLGMARMAVLFRFISAWCKDASRPIVLMIDEVDSASNNQVFLNFLAQLRGYYLNREERPAFHSVILAGVHDIRNLRKRIRPDEDHKHNSPWNIAADFDVNMSFMVSDIVGMLAEYEHDYHTGMDIQAMAQLIYDYTSGYPVLVSMFCKLLDEEIAGTEVYPSKTEAWTKKGFLEAEKLLYNKRLSIFESLINKLEDSGELKSLLYHILFGGQTISYNLYDGTLGSAVMYGFLKNQNGVAVIANRIFETMIYNWFISLEQASSQMYRAGTLERTQYIQNGHLNMELILERFVQHFTDLYGEHPETFVEEDGRKYFLLFLKPIINGTGNYYIEAQTRDQKRTDVIVDYLGERFIIELKIWHGAEYNRRGEKQLADYLEYFHVQKGYMLSFNFNQKKQTGVRTIQLEDKTIVEAVV